MIGMSVGNASAQQSASPERGVLARNPLVFYFLIAFSFSWLMFLPAVLTYYGVLNVSPSIVGLMGIAGLLGPSLSGFIMTGITEGRAGIRRLLRRIVLWRVGLLWYLFALTGIPLVMVLATLLFLAGAL